MGWNRVLIHLPGELGPTDFGRQRSCSVSRKHPGKCDPMIFGYYQSSRSSICVSRKHLPRKLHSSLQRSEIFVF